MMGFIFFLGALFSFGFMPSMNAISIIVRLTKPGTIEIAPPGGGGGPPIPGGPGGPGGPRGGKPGGTGFGVPVAPKGGRAGPPPRRGGPPGRAGRGGELGPPDGTGGVSGMEAPSPSRSLVDKRIAPPENPIAIDCRCCWRLFCWSPRIVAAGVPVSCSMSSSWNSLDLHEASNVPVLATPSLVS